MYRTNLPTIHVADCTLPASAIRFREFEDSQERSGVEVRVKMATIEACLHWDAILPAISDTLLKLNITLQKSLDGFVSELMMEQRLLPFAGILILTAAWVVLVLRRKMRAQIAKIYEAARLQSEALNLVEDAICVLDRRGDIQWVNSGFFTLTGYPVKEVIGKNFRMLDSDQNPQDLYRTIWNTVLTGNVWRNKLRSRRKDGSLFQEEVTITPVWDESGNVAHFIAVKRDITPRNLAEDALRQSESRDHEFIPQEIPELIRPQTPFEPIHEQSNPTDAHPRTETLLAEVFDRSQSRSRVGEDEDPARKVTATVLDKCPNLMQNVHHPVRERHPENP